MRVQCLSRLHHERRGSCARRQCVRVRDPCQGTRRPTLWVPGLHSMQRVVSRMASPKVQSRPCTHPIDRSHAMWLVPQPCCITNINKEVIFHKMVFESRNLGPSASNSACGSTKNMSHRAGCDLRLRSRVASTTPKTCFLVQYRHCELRNFKNHDPRNRNREMIALAVQ